MGKFVVSHAGYHFEFLARRLADDHVEYLDKDLKWNRIMGDCDPVQCYLSKLTKNFEGPLQTAKYIGNEPGIEYIVYLVNINPQQ